MQPIGRTGEAWLLVLILGLTAAACATPTSRLRGVSFDSQPRTLDSELRTILSYNSQIENKASLSKNEGGRTRRSA